MGKVPQNGYCLPYTGKKLEEMLNARAALPPLTISTFADNQSFSMGKVRAGSYVNEVVFEIPDGIEFDNGERYEMAIGTQDDEAKFCYWKEITYHGTFAAPIQVTFSEETEIFAYLRKYRSKFQHTLVNPFPDSSDIDFRDITDTVVKIKVVSDALDEGKYDDAAWKELQRNAAFYDTFRFPYRGDRVLDFGFNFKTERGKRYRVVETNNPAVSYMWGLYGVTHTEEDGSDEWKRTTIVNATGDSVDYHFLIGKAQGEDDYIHIQIFDESADSGDQPIAAYHIHNRIGLETPQYIHRVNIA